MPSVDLTGYYVHWVNAEPITYTSAVTGDTGEIDVALRRAVTLADVQTFGLTPDSEAAAWHLPVELMDAENLVPRRNDRIVQEDGTAWRVDNVETQTLISRYRLVCVKEVNDG
jgi:hypothetical protein